MGTLAYWLVILSINVVALLKTEHTIWGSFIVLLVSSLTSLDSTASLHNNNHIISFLVKSNLFNLETNCTVILP